MIGGSSLQSASLAPLSSLTSLLWSSRAKPPAGVLAQRTAAWFLCGTIMGQVWVWAFILLKLRGTLAWTCLALYMVYVWAGPGAKAARKAGGWPKWLQRYELGLAALLKSSAIGLRNFCVRAADGSRHCDLRTMRLPSVPVKYVWCTQASCSHPDVCAAAILASCIILCGPGLPCRWSLWHLVRDYFSARLVRTAHLPPHANYIFSMHPHGIAALSAFIHFATQATGFEKLFPGEHSTPSLSTGSLDKSKYC